MQANVGAPPALLDVGESGRQKRESQGATLGSTKRANERERMCVTEQQFTRYGGGLERMGAFRKAAARYVGLG